MRRHELGTDVLQLDVREYGSAILDVGGCGAGEGVQIVALIFAFAGARSSTLGLRFCSAAGVTHTRARGIITFDKPRNNTLHTVCVNQGVLVGITEVDSERGGEPVNIERIVGGVAIDPHDSRKGVGSKMPACTCKDMGAAGKVYDRDVMQLKGGARAKMGSAP